MLAHGKEDRMGTSRHFEDTNMILFGAKWGRFVIDGYNLLHRLMDFTR
jgi:hypothetical protein